MTDYPEPAPLIASFGRRQGRTLRPHQKQLVQRLLPMLTPAALTQPHNIDLEAWFGKSVRHLRLEIGFGGGEHLAAQALSNPDVCYIGCEPYMNGVAKLLHEIESSSLKNIRLFTDDARLLMAHLPDGCLEEVYILFPDPWPKARHHKRRLIQQEMLSALARLQPVGARLLLASDHEEYGVWMLEQVLAHPDYEWTARCEADWSCPPADWVATRYQRKTTAQGRPPLFIDCRRR